MVDSGCCSDQPGDDTCAICLGELSEAPLCGTGKHKPKTLKLRTCGHTFHKHCAELWFEAERNRGRVATCPMCRVEVKAPKKGKQKSKAAAHAEPATNTPARGPRAFFSRLFSRRKRSSTASSAPQTDVAGRRRLLRTVSELGRVEAQRVFQIQLGTAANLARRPPPIPSTAIEALPSVDNEDRQAQTLFVDFQDPALESATAQGLRRVQPEFSSSQGQGTVQNAQDPRQSLRLNRSSARRARPYTVIVSAGLHGQHHMLTLQLPTSA